VSFAIIPEADLFDVKSLTLLRTPKYEFILDDTERGVNVSYDDFPEDEDDYLERIEVGKDLVRLVTNHRRYMLDVRHVDDDQKRRMKRILRKMNFDNRFTLKVL
jgi:chloramphenicol 3-O-phosphotransferase